MEALRRELRGAANMDTEKIMVVVLQWLLAVTSSKS